jgi:uncharacterized protein (TIGR02271 family)
MDDIRTYSPANTVETDGIREDNPLIQDRTIAALFSDETQAQSAKEALKDAGFDDVDITRKNEGDAFDDDSRPAHEHGFWDSVKNFFSGDDDAYAYGEGVRRGHTLVTVHAEQGRAAQAVEILDGFDPIDVEGSEQAWRSDGWSRDTARSAYETSPSYQADRDRFQTNIGRTDTAFDSDDRRDEQVIPVVEENLSVGKRDVAGGNVRVRSYVREVPVSESVTLRQESVNVERRPVDRPLTDSDDAFQDRTIEARETNEEAVIGKTARVVEEVVVSKDVSQRTEEIDDTVRKTEVEVDDERRDSFDRTSR